jgi:hypothetical protein
MPQSLLFADTQIGQTVDLGQEMRSLNFDSGASLLQFGFGLINKTNKQISQLIAKAWLDCDPSIVNETTITDFLVENHLISEGDRKMVKVVIDTKPYSKWSDAGASNKNKPKEKPPQENYVGYWTFFENPAIPGPNKLETNLYVPFPDKPKQVTDATLDLWVKQSPAQAPFYPDPALGLPEDAVWIPYSC